MMEQRSKYTTQGVCSEFVGELVQLLFISPESLLSNPQWREMLLLPVHQESGGTCSGQQCGMF